MPRTFALELPETFDVLERDRGLTETFVPGVDCLHACEMQGRIEQHRGVPVGKHKTIAIRPDRILGVEP